MTNDPGSRRGRISRDQIIDTALDLVRVDGVARLTMRRVATALKVEPMSLYHHVAGKPALLAAMADRSLSQLPDAAADMAWDERLVDLMVQAYRAGTANPVVFEVLSSPPEVILTLPELGSSAPLGFLERVLELLEEGGLAVDDQVPIYRGLIGLVVGFIVAETAASTPTADGEPHQHANAAARFASLRPLLEKTDPEPDLRLNLRHLLDGFPTGSDEPDRSNADRSGSPTE